MILFIDQDSERPLFAIEQFLSLKEFNNVHRDYGLMGLYFVVLYGWKASPYYQEKDLKHRTRQVIAAIGNKKWYDESTSLFSYSGGAKKPEPSSMSPDNVVLKAAIAKINEVVKVPLLEAKDTYEEYLKREKQDLEKETNPDIRKKIFANIETLQGLLKDTEAEIERKMKSKMFASLDTFINMFI